MAHGSKVIPSQGYFKRDGTFLIYIEISGVLVGRMVKRKFEAFVSKPDLSSICIARRNYSTLAKSPDD